MNLTSIEEVLSVRPAIIIGERSTAVAADRAALRATIISDAEKAGIEVRPEHRDSIGRFFDAIRASSKITAEQLERKYREGLTSLTQPVDLKHLAGVQWSAVVSICSDTTFEHAMQLRLDASPSSRTLTLISHPSTTIPARSTPVFRLLGDPSTSEPGRKVAVSTADYTLRKQCWQDLLSQFSDHAKNGAVLILGALQDSQLLHDCLATLVSLKGPIPKRFVFLEHPDGISDPTLLGMLQGRAEVISVKGTLQEFCAAAATSTRKPVQMPLELDASKRTQRVFADYSDAIGIPSITLPADFDPNRRGTELRDALFRPMALDWRPFLAAIDLKRDQLTAIRATIDDQLVTLKQGCWPVFALKGEAGVGKTTLLKRLAVDLAKSGTLVCWLKRRSAVGVVSVVREFCKKLKEAFRDEKAAIPPIVFICDDPVALDVPAEDLVFAIESSGLPAATLFGIRNSDDLLVQFPVWNNPRFPYQEAQLDYQLGDVDLGHLESFLVLHQIAADKDAASRMVKTVPANRASDILCSLWYLVPDTKQQIEASLESEYFRLGSAGRVVESLAEQARSGADIARRAYEIVAVASSLDLAVPVEVLVRAVAAGSYSDWLEQFGYGQPLWGLLYDDFDIEQNTYSYRTRNLVVTEVLVRLIDQGMGHAGRYRVLKDLVSACRGGNELYRAFLAQLLVKRRAKLESFLYSEEGLELFDLAYEDGGTDAALMLHHKGLWLRHRGDDAAGAYALMEKALSLAAADQTQRESRENIHVSMAAAIADRLERGEIGAPDALESVRSHLAEARARGYFDTHVSYVLAKTLVRVARRSNEAQTTIESACKALSEVDRGLLAIGGSAKNLARNYQGIERLLEVQRSVVQLFSGENIRQISSALSGDAAAIAVELQARLLLREAANSGQGRRFNEIMELLDPAIAAISMEQWPRQLGLREVRALTMIRWRLSTTRGEVNWGVLQADVAVLLKSPQYSADAVWRYYHALATFHLNQVQLAMAEFSALRPLARHQPAANTMRNFLLGKEGHPHRLQGIFHRSHDRKYVSLSQLELDAEANEAPSHLKEGDTCHCYLAFRLTGIRAYFGDPKEQNLDLPYDEFDA
jgi:hypothetical protein